MHVNFAYRGRELPKNRILQVDGARITFRNFEGRKDKYNKEGDRNFALVITDEEIKDAMVEDLNEFGVGFNVKVRAPREEGDIPFMYLPVAVKFNDYGPEIYLICGNKRTRLDKDSVGCLDRAIILNVDMDIRVYDEEGNYGPFRKAYLQKMYVTIEEDRLAARYGDLDDDGQNPY